MVLSQAQLESSRADFLAGVKAAFIIGQLNRLGQVLCAKCGRAFDGLNQAWQELDLYRVLDTGRPGYRGDLDWGEDHPNQLLLACSRCRRTGR